MNYSIKNKIKADITQDQENVYNLDIKEVIKTRSTLSIELGVNEDLFKDIDKVSVNCGCVVPLIEDNCVYVEFTPKYLGDHVKTITLRYKNHNTDYIKLKAKAV